MLYLITFYDKALKITKVFGYAYTTLEAAKEAAKDILASRHYSDAEIIKITKEQWGYV